MLSFFYQPSKNMSTKDSVNHISIKIQLMIPIVQKSILSGIQ